MASIIKDIKSKFNQHCNHSDKIIDKGNINTKHTLVQGANIAIASIASTVLASLATTGAKALISFVPHFIVFHDAIRVFININNMVQKGYNTEHNAITRYVSDQIENAVNSSSQPVSQLIDQAALKKEDAEKIRTAYYTVKAVAKDVFEGTISGYCVNKVAEYALKNL